MSNLPQGMAINAEVTPEFATILTPEALALVAKLHRAFEPRRQELLKARVERTKRLDAGEKPDFLPETKHIREGDWKVAPIPAAQDNGLPPKVDDCSPLLIVVKMSGLTRVAPIGTPPAIPFARHIISGTVFQC